MAEQPQFVLVPVDDFRALASEVRQLRETVERATITPAPIWITIPEAAVALGCSVATVRRRIDSGEIEARGTGKLRRVRLSPTD